MIRHVLRACILLIALIIAAGPMLTQAARDPLANIEDMPAPQLQVLPSDLFAPVQKDALNGIVNEARQFGVPLVVRVISVPTTLDLLPEISVVAGSSPDGQQIVERMAEEWLAKEGVETSQGAGDGILLLVVVPEDDHTQARAAFATGPRALPLNGLTESSLDRVLNEIIYPFFGRNAIAGGIHSGIAYLSYDNLFAVPAARPLSHQQETLHRLTNLGLASLTILSSLALGGLIIWIQRRDKTSGAHGPEVTSPFVAGALARGRADSAVTTGALLHLMQLGAIDSHRAPAGEMILTLHNDVPLTDPVAKHVFHLLASEADSSNQVQGAAIRRIQDVLAPARDNLRDQLATRKLFNPDALVETVWILIACAAVAAVALFSLMPSMLGLSRVGIFGIAIAAIAIILALRWVTRRSWTTMAGKQALATWQSADHSLADQAAFAAIANQDDLILPEGGPATPHITQLARSFRGLGAG